MQIYRAVLSIRTHSQTAIQPASWQLTDPYCVRSCVREDRCVRPWVCVLERSKNVGVVMGMKLSNVKIAPVLVRITYTWSAISWRRFSNLIPKVVVNVKIKKNKLQRERKMERTIDITISRNFWVWWEKYSSSEKN